MNHSPLTLAVSACDTMMRKFAPEKLPPVGQFHYHQGVFLSGMFQTYLLTGEEKYFTYVKDWVDSIFGSDGSIHTFDPGKMDDMQPGILLFPLYERTCDLRYKKALDILSASMDVYPRCACRGFWHTWELDNQMWLDGLYMGGPLLAMYGRAFSRPEYFDEVVYQCMTMKKNTYDAQTGLLYHAWDEGRKALWSDPKTGCSHEFWGRSIGWVLIAILDILAYLPENHAGILPLKHMLSNLLTAIARYQDEVSGLWYQVVNKGSEADNWLETSCSCLYVAALARATRLGIMDQSYLTRARKGFEGVAARLKWDEEGIRVEGVCIGTGVGDYAHYIHRPTSVNDLHGMGAFLLMCTAMSIDR